MWFAGEFLRVICCGWRDILWAINLRLASQWEGIQHNFPVGLRRYEPSISTVGKAEDLESVADVLSTVVLVRVSVTIFLQDIKIRSGIN